MIHIIITCRKSEPILVRSFLCGVKHIFYNKHQTYNGYTTLYPDYDMAVAWKRLLEGVPEARNLLLLRHELLESRVERMYNLPLDQAHAKANEKYNWQELMKEMFGEDGEADDLL